MSQNQSSWCIELKKEIQPLPLRVLVQPLFLWRVTADTAQVTGELLPPPRDTHAGVTQTCPSLFFEEDC